MQDLTVLLVQTDTIWEEPTSNFENIERLLAKKKADLIVLPETFNTGFSMDSKTIAEEMDGPTVSWMKKTAQKFNSTLTGSVLINSEGRRFNRLLWVSQNGELEYYDKRHLIGLMGETKHYSPGTDRKVFKLGSWRICPQVCYDLRFPVWCRNQDDYDLLLFVANWPSPRHVAWTTLLHARAIENQCYVVGVNRTGRDGTNVEFKGGSLVVDPLGNTLEQFDDEQRVATVTLSGSELLAIREKLPFLGDRDPFSIL